MKTVTGVILVLMMFVCTTSYGAVVYVDAEGGAGGNTVNASTGSNSDWWVASPLPDGKWGRRLYGNDPTGTLGTAEPADIFEASGTDTGSQVEDCMPIKTTISGLKPGWTYQVRVLYWTAAPTQNWTIRAGFSLVNMLYFDRDGADGATAGTLTTRTQADRSELTALIGQTTADGSGQVMVYINDRPATGFGNRTWYDGLQYEEFNVAHNPSPADGAINIPLPTATLSFDSMRDPNHPALEDPNLVSHKVYFDDDPNLADAIDLIATLPKGTNQTTSPALDYNKKYYWRVDEVRNNGTTVTGFVWTFETIKTAPEITRQPVNTVIMQGESGSLTIGATSISPDLVYTWKKSTDTVIDDGDTPVGTDANTLTINPAAASDDGYYYCKLTNAGGANTIYSNVVMLGVEREIAHWTLDSDANSWDGTYYLDETPLTIDPVVQNADPNGTPDFDEGADGMTDGAVTIDTVNGYASAGTWNPSQFTNQFTVSLWAKWAGQTTPTTWQGLISKETSYGANNMMWQLEVSQAAQASSTVVLKNGLGTGDRSTPPLPVGAWEHIAVTFDGTTATVYRNGISASSGAWTMGTKTDAPVNIGISARSLTQNLMFNGMLDDIRIYNYARTPHQVADTYYTVTGKPVCTEPYASEFDVTGPVDGVKDCVVDIKDFAKFAAKWIDCGLYPTWRCP